MVRLLLDRPTEASLVGILSSTRNWSKYIAQTGRPCHDLLDRRSRGDDRSTAAARTNATLSADNQKTGLLYRNSWSSSGEFSTSSLRRQGYPVSKPIPIFKPAAITLNEPRDRQSYVECAAADYSRPPHAGTDGACCHRQAQVNSP